MNLAATVDLVADFWRDHDWQVAVRPTRSAGHATELARGAADSGHRLVLAAGGDGTLGEVANGLAGTETVMAPLPVGTANSFARELRMPRPGFFNRQKLLEASEALAAGRVWRADLGRARTGQNTCRYWLLWAGTGADGYLVDQLEPRPKWSKKLGRLGYITQSLAVGLHLPKMIATIEIDDRVIEDQFLLVVICNCRRYAGGEVLLSPQAKLDDGLFEVWLFRGHGLARAVRFFWQAKLHRHHVSPDVTLVKCRRVVVQTEPIMQCQTDGERAGNSPLSCEMVPGALSLLVPNTAPSDLFDRPGEPLI